MRRSLRLPTVAQDRLKWLIVSLANLKNRLDAPLASMTLCTWTRASVDLSHATI
jgi:hypothetical protein